MVCARNAPTWQSPSATVRHEAARPSPAGTPGEFSRACGGLMLTLMVPALAQCPLLVSGDGNALRRFLLPAFPEIKTGDPHPFSFAITEPTAGAYGGEGHGAIVSAS